MKVYARGAAPAAGFLKKTHARNLCRERMDVIIAVFMRSVSGCAGLSAAMSFFVYRSARSFPVPGRDHINAHIKNS